MISFARKPSRNQRALQVEKITAWVEEALLASGITHSSDEFTVSISEISCSEPGCAPVETVVCLLGSDQTNSIKNFKGKVFKPILKVSREDIIETVPRILRLLKTDKESAQSRADNASSLQNEGRKAEKKSLIDLWAEVDAKKSGHPELCVCCAPIQ